MTKPINRLNKNWLLLPLSGILAFVCLYFIATLYYPGGSQADTNATEFSWLHNYWCNLLNEKAINGQSNIAKPIAMTAMLTLSFSLAIFWYIFPTYINFKKQTRLIIQVSGAISMLFGLFLFSRFHDAMVNLASFFGIVATAGIFIGLQKLKWKKLFLFGIFNLLLIILNNILYYGEGLKLYLPVVQKITFLFFLSWICLIALQLFNKRNHST